MTDDSSSTMRAGGGGSPRPLYRTQTAPVPNTEKPRFAPVGVARSDGASGRRPGCGKIFVDVAETENKYTICADLPGCRPDDIVVLLKENVLQLKAERQPRQPGDGTICHRSERFFGRISRALLLPTSCRTDSVVASYENGVLTVSIDKVR